MQKFCKNTDMDSVYQEYADLVYRFFVFPYARCGMVSGSHAGNVFAGNGFHFPL